MPAIKEAIVNLEKRLSSKENAGRVLIRPSGTELLIRIMLEGRDKAVLEEEASMLAELMIKEFSVFSIGENK